MANVQTNITNNLAATTDISKNREHMTNTIFICHVLTPRQKYGKFNVGSRPMRVREYTTMNNNYNYAHVTSTKKTPRSWAAYDFMQI